MWRKNSVGEKEHKTVYLYRCYTYFSVKSREKNLTGDDKSYLKKDIYFPIPRITCVCVCGGEFYE